MGKKISSWKAEDMILNRMRKHQQEVCDTKKIMNGKAREQRACGAKDGLRGTKGKRDRNHTTKHLAG